MNVIILSGRLTNNPELKENTSTKVCQFSLAVDRDRTDSDGKREVDFVECVSFGKNAENMTKYLVKGSMIELKGRLQIDRYTNKEGKNISRALVYIETIKYISQPKTTSRGAKNDEKDPYQEMGNKVSN